MKAIVCRNYGSPEVLQLQDVPKPVPTDKEVLIKFVATAVPASDVLLRGLEGPFIYRFLIQMMLGFGKPKNPVLGMVLSGIVEQVGSNVRMFQRGDAVFASCSMSAFKIRFGSYAEYICLPEDWNMTNKPTNISFQQAAAIPYGAGLAWFYFKKLKIMAGQKVLIYGASGSVGLMAIQLATSKGAIVTAVCSAKNFELVESLGAQYSINYRMPNAAVLLEQYDVVFDAVGKSKSSELKVKCKKALTSRGKYISVDDSAPSTSKTDFLQIAKAVKQGILKPTIDRTYPLAQMVEAHQYVEQGHKTGSVVILM